MPKGRNYRNEYDSYQGTEEQKKARAKRNAARRRKQREVGKEALKGKDIDHKKPLRNGGSNAKSNTRVRDRSANRSDNGHKKGKKK